MTPPYNPGQDTLISSFYSQHAGQPVAFIDETYQLPGAGYEPFYVMTSVIVQASELDGLRGQLDKVVPHGYFHGTETLKEDSTGTLLHDVLGCLDVTKESTVLVHHRAISTSDRTGEQARQECLARLLVALDNPGQAEHPAVALTIMEERPNRSDNNNDRRTRKNLIADQALSPGSNLVHVSPRAERLLWLPDAVSTAYRQKITRNRSEFIQPLGSCTSVLTFP